MVSCGWRDSCAMVWLVVSGHIGFRNLKLTKFGIAVALKLRELFKYLLGPFTFWWKSEQIDLGSYF